MVVLTWFQMATNIVITATSMYFKRDKGLEILLHRTTVNVHHASNFQTNRYHWKWLGNYKIHKTDSRSSIHGII